MNIQQAREILGIASDTTPEDAKKKYKQLTKQFHPDINKEPDAEAKFKKINEAYQVVSSGKSTDPQGDQGVGIDLNDLFSNLGGFGVPFRNAHSRPAVAPINAFQEISFREAVLGTKRDLKFNRQVACRSCEGNGFTHKDNGCLKCQGKGTITMRRGNSVMVSTCSACHGKTAKEDCSTCQTSGTLSADTSISVSIPPGIISGNVLRLPNMGHFAGTFMGMQQHSDLLLHLTVIPQEGLSLQEDDVISYLSISLLEALQGCDKTVSTIDGDKEILIPARSKHQDILTLPSLGVAREGNQQVILNINYPANLDQLINLLQKEAE